MKDKHMGGMGGMPSQAPKRTRADVTQVTTSRPHSGPGGPKQGGRTRADVTMASVSKPC